MASNSETVARVADLESSHNVVCFQLVKESGVILFIELGSEGEMPMSVDHVI
jgi:hypothetical protein